MKINKKIVIFLIVVGWGLYLFNPLFVFAEDSEENPKVSTVFYETDIRDALNELAMQTGVNIIYDDTVQGTVNLELDDVSLKKALKMILIKGGYNYQKTDDFYLVGLPDPDSAVFREISTTEKIDLDYITSEQLSDLLPDFYLDFIETSKQKEKMVTITAPETIITEFKKVLNKIDNPKKEVLIKVLVTEISTEVFSEREAKILEYFSGEGNDEHSFSFKDGFELSTGGNYGQLLGELKALAGEEKAEIISDPQIRVTSGETAELFVGEEKSIFLQPENEDTKIEDVEVGVYLEVTPEIVNENELQVQITPDVSNLISETRDELVVKKSKVSTSVLTENKENIFLSGMTLEETIEYENGVPLLKDIPLVRWLFSSKKEQVEEKELIVFMTPEIINGD